MSRGGEKRPLGHAAAALEKLTTAEVGWLRRMSAPGPKGFVRRAGSQRRLSAPMGHPISNPTIRGAFQMVDQMTRDALPPYVRTATAKYTMGSAVMNPTYI